MSALPIVIVGAGAAGLMAAIFAAGDGDSESRPVLVLERTRDGGRKILISGGGRCNVLPSELAPARFVTDSSPNTLRNLLRSWPLADQRAFFERTLGVPLKLEAETGKLFPVSDRARDVRDALIAHARRLGVSFRFDTQVTDLTPPSTRETGATAAPSNAGRAGADPASADPAAADPAAATAPGNAALPAMRRHGDAASGHSAAPSAWTLRLADGSTMAAAAVILATGGLSVPATGSDGVGLRIVRHLGHRVHDTYAALTPLIADPPVHESLSGISLTVTLRAASTAVRAVGGFLFTHRGYSGPSVLDISHLAVRARLAEREQPLLAQWTALDAEDWRAALAPPPGRTDRGRALPGQALVVGRLRQHLPSRLADWLAVEAGVGLDRSLATLTRDQRERLIQHLCAYPLPWTGDEGYKKAEVTGGGLALDEVEARTLHSRRQRGLFCCGELLDAFGPIGGHNFAWAWATGRLAGLGARAFGRDARVVYA